MNKKLLLVAIAGWTLSGALAYELVRLAGDFKTAHKIIEEQKEVVEMATNIVTAIQFQEIIENNDM